ncbi:hypothetical protein ACFQT0_19355 [Hymenobacter humi]|uniref:Uncharacterized protein n=1 Tax=Hymenobacter humi TaxID=1411620 RepID=A0ABW2UB09_9BACT
MADRDLRLRELWAKHAEEEEKRRQDDIDKKIAQSNADAEVLVAQAELDLANGVLTEQQYQDAIYAVKQAAMQRELDLIQQQVGQESVAWKKLHADKIKDEADHTKKVKGEKASLSEFNKKMTEVDKFLNSENVKFLEESLGKQTVAFKVFSVAKKAMAVHNIGLALVEEIQDYWKTAAGYGPVAGPIYGIGMSGLATLRAGMAVAKIAGFAKGGATGDGGVVPGANVGMLSMLGMSVGSNGKLSDGSGFEVAGLVHKNEYVIPEWMRADPEVLQVEGWLERRRLQGYAQGGATSDGGSQAAAEEQAVGNRAGAASEQRLVQVLENLDRRLQGVEQWATTLEVVQDLFGLDRDLDKLKKVKAASEIRPK